MKMTGVRVRFKAAVEYSVCFALLMHVNARFVSVTPLPIANSKQTVPRPRHVRHENAARPDGQIEDKYPQVPSHSFLNIPIPYFQTP